MSYRNNLVRKKVIIAFIAFTLTLWIGASITWGESNVLCWHECAPDGRQAVPVVTWIILNIILVWYYIVEAD